MAKKDQTAYDKIIQKVFFDRFRAGSSSFEFIRRDIVEAKDLLAKDLDLNPGDVVYSYRFRRPFPTHIIDTQPEGLEWVIEGAGRAKYRFKLVKKSRIEPNTSLFVTSIPDATPEIIRAYALDDEQALLAIVRYNRLVDTFLGLTTYSLRNHLRTTVKGIGQIEIDELYIGLDKRGCHYSIPVQAKGGKDQIGVVQISQDIKFSEEKFPGMKCRAIAAQFMNEEVVVLFELALQNEELKVIDEKHYRLVSARQLDDIAVRDYRENL